MSERLPVVYHNGIKWKNFPVTSEHDMGKAIFVGGGPSLGKIKTAKLTGPGKTVFGINNTYPTVRPDYWIGMDDPECYDSHLLFDPMTKIFRGGFQDKEFHGRTVKEYPNTYFLNITEVGFYEWDKFFSFVDEDTEKFGWYKNTFMITMQLMIHMGYKEIYLAGHDMSAKDGDYFNDVELNDEEKAWNKDLYDYLYKFLKWLAPTAKMAGINIYSISPDSPINEIVPYVSLEKLNRSLELPAKGELLHAKAVDEKQSTVISPEYRAILKEEHKRKPWGFTAGNKIGPIMEACDRHECKTILDYGCGSSSFKKNLNREDITVKEYDPGIFGKDRPPKPQEFVICIDVLEHVEPDMVDGVLKNLEKLTKKAGYLSIATRPAERILADGRNAHLVVEKPSWWYDKLSQHFDIKRFDILKGEIEVEVIRKSK